MSLDAGVAPAAEAAERRPVRALVTGGSGAIGAAICRRLALQGMAVIVHAHGNSASAERVAEAIRTAGGSASTSVFDVSDADACLRALDAVLADGPVQVVVSNAGIHDDAPLAGMSRRQWRAPIDVSLDGFFHVVQPLLLPMLRTRWGRVIGIASVSAILGNRGQANYAAAKAGMIGACRCLALEVASRGVTVNVVAPGIVDSPMTRDLFGDDDLRRLVPMQRMGTPDDVAAAVAFLASRDAGYVSGQVLGVNGAMG